MTTGPLRTLFARLLVAMLALLLLAAGPLMYISLSTHRAALERRYEESVSIVASSLASAAFDATASRNFPTLQAVVESTASDKRVDAAFVVDPGGKIWAHSDPRLAGSRHPAAGYSRSCFDRAVPIGPPGAPIGYAHAGIRKERLERELDASQGALAILLVFSVAAAALMAVVLSSHLSRPIHGLTVSARAIARGDLDSPVGDVRGPEEVREMARTFEDMRVALRSNMQRLERSHAQLDRRVRDLSILYDVSEAMNRGDYSEGLLDMILSAALDGTRARFGVLLLKSAEGEEPRVVASRGIDPRSMADGRRSRLEAVAGAAMREGRTAREETAGAGEGGGEESLHAIAVPLLVGEESAGAMAVASNEWEFAGEDAELVEALASHAARCVERTQLYAASITDGLTGLYVSRYFRGRLKEELRTAARYRHPVSLVMVDIDHFKKVNDTWDHPAGDEVLRVVARCIERTVRDGIDLAARYGGEEFALVLPETGKEGAIALAERLRELIGRQQIKVTGATVQVTASLGVATSPDDGLRPEVLVEQADAALYEAKRQGRNRTVGAIPQPCSST